jgi:hypothetical protein
MTNIKLATGAELDAQGAKRGIIREPSETDDAYRARCDISPSLPQQGGEQTVGTFSDVSGTFAAKSGTFQAPDTTQEQLRHMLSRWVALGKTDHMARWLIAETEALLNGQPHPEKPFDTVAPPLPQQGGNQTELSKELREYASNPGYSHQDYADVMENAADEIERLRTAVSPQVGVAKAGGCRIKQDSRGNYTAPVAQALPVAAEMLKDAERYRKLQRWMASNVPEGWSIVEELGAITAYLSFEELDAQLDALPVCNVGLCQVTGMKP